MSRWLDLMLRNTKRYRWWFATMGGLVVGVLLFAIAPRVWNRIMREAFPLRPANFSKSEQPHFPVKKAPNGHYLVDQDGKPFMIVADSGWGLIGNLDTRDAAVYFSNRASLGFNSVLMTLAVSDYAGSKIAGYQTFDGLTPFIGGTSSKPGPLSLPNEPYWNRVDALINLAATLGLNVIAFPLETGGWLKIMEAEGVSACYRFGVFLGTRYRDFPNIIWAFGNDYDEEAWSVTSTDVVVKAVANGILSQDKNHLVTIELGGPLGTKQSFGQSISTDNSRWWNILGLNSGYSYFPTYATAKAVWLNASIPVLPYVLGESGYENESWSGVEGTAKTCRRENWCSILGGGLGGVMYGNRYIWYFATGGVWQKSLNTRGAIECGYLRSFLERLHWWELEADFLHKFCTRGYGTEFTDLTHASTRNQSSQSYIAVDGFAPAMVTPDGSLGIVYVQNATTLSINLSLMAGNVTAQWYDPTNNTYSSVGTYPNSGTHEFRSPPSNSAGDQDHVLLLTATKREGGTPPVGTL
jgi:hypothetical protein